MTIVEIRIDVLYDILTDYDLCDVQKITLANAINKLTDSSSDAEIVKLRERRYKHVFTDKRICNA